MRILAFGGWFGSGNIGDDAILMGIKEVFTEVIDELELTALSTDPNQITKACGVHSLRLLKPTNLTSYSRYLKTLKSFDAYIVTGGTPFYDYDYLSRLLHYILPLTNRKPLVCFGVGAKRITSLIGKLLTRKLLRMAKRISARDVLSKKRLEVLSGKNIVLTGDSALFLAKAHTVNSKHNNFDYEVEGSYVAICPRKLSMNYKKHYHDQVTIDNIYSIRTGLARLADHLLKEGKHVIFVPMHRATGDDDLEEINAIRSSMTFDGTNVVEPDDIYDAASILGHAELVAGLRLHSLILAASYGVPVISIGYDEKIHGFMEMLGASEFIAEPYGLIEKSVDALSRRVELNRRYLKRCELMKHRIMNEAAIVSRMFR